MLWPLLGKSGGVTLAASTLLSRRRLLGAAAAYCCRWSGQARHGGVLRSAIGLALQCPHRRMAAHGLLGRWPLHPRGGARHQLDPARSRHRRDPADERRCPRCARDAARPPRHAATRFSWSAAIARRPPTGGSISKGVGVAKHSYHIKGMAVDLRSERRSIEQIRNAALEPQMRRRRLLSAFRLCPCRLRPGPPVAGIGAHVASTNRSSRRPANCHRTAGMPRGEAVSRCRIVR